MASFRNEIFEVCKLLKSDNSFDSLRETMFNLMVITENYGKSIRVKTDISNSGNQLN